MHMQNSGATVQIVENMSDKTYMGFLGVTIWLTSQTEQI